MLLSNSFIQHAKKKIILFMVSDAQYASTMASFMGDYTVIRCHDQREAVAACSREPVSLAVIENELPGQKAAETLATLRLCSPGIVAILLSSDVGNETLTACFSAGFSGLLHIPFVPDQLLGMIEQAFLQKEIRDENIHLRTLLPLYALGEQFLSSTSEQEVVNGLLDSVAELTGSPQISILLYDEQQARLHVAAAKGMDKSMADSIRMLPGEKIAGWVFTHGKPVLLNREDQEKTIFAPFLKRKEIVSSMSCPILIRGRILGVLNISKTETEDRFTEVEKEVMSIVCGQAALALENVRALQRLEETTRTRTLLQQFMAPEVAELLLAEKADPMGLGDIRQVTILFADIRNFTGLVQHLDLNVLRFFLNEFFNIFTDTIFQHQGTVDKFMGDAVLALFGAPVRNARANSAAVEAALLIKKRFERLHNRWLLKNAVFADIDLGIGVTSGNVFLGNVGSSKRFDYTVIGNEVNIAQRLAAESSQCRIFVTESVQRDIQGQFVLEKKEKMRLRGIKEAVSVYAVRGTLA